MKKVIFTVMYRDGASERIEAGITTMVIQLAMKLKSVRWKDAAGIHIDWH